MANLKEIRNRISTVTSTKQITSAMKMVAASKLRKAQDTILHFRPYSALLENIVGELGASVDKNLDSPYFSVRPVKNVLIIPVTSNKGLCGSFNSSITKATRNLIEEKYADAKVDLFIVGRKANDFFKNKGLKIIENDNTFVDKVDYEKRSLFALMLIDLFLTEKYDVIEFVYNQFKNPAVQIIQQETFLPFSLKGETKKTGKYYKNYIFEPSKEKIINEIIPFVLKTKVNKIFLDSVASEHGARMTAMHKATDNAADLLFELKLSYNKARQASITNEILEIVSGANALRG